MGNREVQLAAVSLLNKVNQIRNKIRIKNTLTNVYLQINIFKQRPKSTTYYHYLHY